jgi:hypothetical protein
MVASITRIQSPFNFLLNEILNKDSISEYSWDNDSVGTICCTKQRLRKHVYVEMRFLDKQSVARRNLQQYMTTVGNRQVFH